MIKGSPPLCRWALLWCHIRSLGDCRWPKKQEQTLTLAATKVTFMLLAVCKRRKDIYWAPAKWRAHCCGSSSNPHGDPRKCFYSHVREGEIEAEKMRRLPSSGWQSRDANRDRSKSKDLISFCLDRCPMHVQSHLIKLAFLPTVL